MSQSMLRGSVSAGLLKLSIPIVLTNILQSTYHLIDMFWVGRISSQAVAAVAMSFPMIFLLISMGAGFAISGTVLVSQFSGKGDQQRVNEYSGQTLLVTGVFSLVFSVLGYFATPFIISMMGSEPNVTKMATSYLQISFIGLFFMYSYMMFQSLFRGIGNVKLPFILVFIAVCFNFFLDPILIHGYGPFPKLGVDGAAYATIITQGFAAILGLFFMFRGLSGIHVRPRNLKPVWKDVIKIINLGLPASAEQSTRALSMLVIMFVVTSFGVIGTAAYGVVARILSFIIIPALGFSMATSTMVGQNIGAGLNERALKTAKRAMQMIFTVLTAIGVVLFFASSFLMDIFVPNDPIVQTEGAYFMKVIAFTFGLIGIQQVISGALRGGGSTILAMILAMASLWMFRFPLAYILSYHTTLGVKGVWWAFCISNITGAIISFVVFQRSNWIKNFTTDFTPTGRRAIQQTINRKY